MHAISNLRLTDSRPSFSPDRDAATADSASSFPGLPEVIGLVEQALQLRRTEAMNAHLAQFLPPLIRRLRAHLPQQLLQPDPRGTGASTCIIVRYTVTRFWRWSGARGRGRRCTTMPSNGGSRP